MKKPIWDKPNPRLAKGSRKKPSKLTPAQKEKAKAFAKRTGTRYPSLVANMAALREDTND